MGAVTCFRVFSAAPVTVPPIDGLVDVDYAFPRDRDTRRPESNPRSENFSRANTSAIVPCATISRRAAAPGTEIENMIRGANGFFIVFDDDDRIAQVA